MTKKVIWAIVGLMTVAVVGATWLQVKLLLTSIELNENKFSATVFDGLNSVVKTLQQEEQTRVSSLTNGYVSKYIRKDLNGTVVQSKIRLDVIVPEKSLLVPGLNTISGKKNYYSLPDEIQRRQNFYGNDLQPLMARFKEERLRAQIDKQLKNRGIQAQYHYAIATQKKGKKNYVSFDGKKPEEITATKEGKALMNHLLKSPYEVTFFPADLNPPGTLTVFFPGKNKLLWRSLWPNVIGMTLFMLIILLSFAYTVNVILRQKKISMMKTDFINNMTHEFKTPIATISLAADSITSPMIVENPDKIKRFATIIKQENKRMNSQVEKVLQMAQIDKNEFSLNMTDINLHEVIQRAVENIGLQVEKKGGKAMAVLEAQNPMIKGDLTHISNVINNLLDNANKYTPENPQIFVSTRNVSSGVEVSIRDNGIGMTAEQRKHIFDKFYRVHTGNLHDVKGFGLGLSYVNAIMVAHKGQIDVKSELGKGSKFILVFPN